MPFPYYLNSEKFEQRLALGYFTPIDAAGFFKPGPNYPKDVPTVYGRKQGDVIFYTYGKDDTPRDRALALLNDLIVPIRMINETKWQSGYSHLDKELKQVEMASYLAQQDHAVIKSLLKNIYQYMLEFFTLDKQLQVHKKQVKNLKEQKNQQQERLVYSQLHEKNSPTFFPLEKQANHKDTQPGKQKHTSTNRPPGQNTFRYGAR